MADTKLAEANCVSNSTLLSDTTLLSKLVAGLNEDDLTCISDATKKDTIVNIFSFRNDFR